MPGSEITALPRARYQPPGPSWKSPGTPEEAITIYTGYLTCLGGFISARGSYGEFRFFTLLFVTLSEQRVENVRRELQDLPEALGAYNRFTTYEQATGDFLGAIWKSRLLSDTTLYPLVR